MSGHGRLLTPAARAPKVRFFEQGFMPDTILQVLDATARAHAERPAMARKRGGAPHIWR